MHKFRTLLGLHFKAMLSSVRLGGGKKRRAVSGVGALIFIAAISLYLSGLYSFLFAGQLAQAGMLPLLLMMMPVLAVGMGFFFTLFAAQGIVFGGRDNDIMLALPVSSFTLMLSRTLALYLENLAFCVFILLPAGAAYLAYGGGGGVWFVAVLLICTLFLALLPTLLSLIFGFLLAWLSSKFVRKTLISTILYFVSFCVLMVFAFRLNFLMAGLASAAADIQQGFSGWGLPFLLLSQAACGGDVPALLAFAALCTLPFLLCVWLFAIRYKHILAGLTARGARSDYKLGKVAAGSQRRALLVKEASRFFGTPIYLFNAGMGLVLMVVAGIASLVMRGRLLASLQLLEQAGVSLPLLPIVAGMLTFLLSTVAVTASSISLEGKQLWILKEAPVSTGNIFAVKVGFQLLLALPCLLVSAVCLSLSLSLPAWQTALLCVVGAAFSLFTALFGLLINLCFPKLDAANDMTVVKQSAAAVIATFGSMVIMLLAAGLYLLLQNTTGPVGALLLCALAFALASALLAGILAHRGRRMFEAL